MVSATSSDVWRVGRDSMHPTSMNAVNLWLSHSRKGPHESGLTSKGRTWSLKIDPPAVAFERLAELAE